MYTLKEGVKIARILDSILKKKFGDAFHVCILGSLVYQGWSKKDIDIGIYPKKIGGWFDSEKTFDPVTLKIRVTNLLIQNGFNAKNKEAEEEESSQRLSEVFPTVYENKNVDIFFFDRFK